MTDVVNWSEEYRSRAPRVMVDIETLGLDPGSAILSIGAVRFDAGEIGETFERSISLSSCQEHGLEIDAGTLEWWFEQGDDAQGQLVGGDDLGDVLGAFSDWYGDADEVWANSPSFDCSLLEIAFDRIGTETPWEFYEERDFRTLKSLPVAEVVTHDGVDHDALDDAMHQAHVASTTLERLEAADGE